jgi:hypothetical protein
VILPLGVTGRGLIVWRVILGESCGETSNIERQRVLKVVNLGGK